MSVVFTPSVAGQYITLDVTSLVQGWVTTPSSNFGLALTSSAANVLFDSKENDETGHPAQLDVTITSMGQQGPVANFRGNWSASTPYAVGDTVAETGTSYIALAANRSVDPATDVARSGTTWAVLAQKRSRWCCRPRRADGSNRSDRGARADGLDWSYGGSGSSGSGWPSGSSC